MIYNVVLSYFVAGNERAFLLDIFGWLGPEHLITAFFIIFPYMHFLCLLCLRVSRLSYGRSNCGVTT